MNKTIFFASAAFAFCLCFSAVNAQSANTVAPQGKDSQSMADSTSPKKMYIDVHHLGAGNVTAKDVVAVHQKDLAIQQKYGVNLMNYWVDEVHGDVYCLSTAPDTLAIHNTHAEAHGLMPDQIYQVTGGQEAAAKKGKSFFLDVHEMGAGKVTAAAVAAAHKKDLAVQGKYGVNFIDYWVNEKDGIIVCLSQAPDSAAVINTHREAHGLLPAYIVKVKPGDENKIDGSSKALLKKDAKKS